MANINLNFMNATDGKVVTVMIDENMKAQEAIAELLDADFMPPHPNGYNLAPQGGDMIRNNQTFAEVGVRDGDKIRVIPATDAGK